MAVSSTWIAVEIAYFRRRVGHVFTQKPLLDNFQVRHSFQGHTRFSKMFYPSSLNVDNPLSLVLTCFGWFFFIHFCFSQVKCTVVIVSLLTLENHTTLTYKLSFNSGKCHI